MLPTFVIALREGVEASLIVGILAAFLRQQGAKDQLRWIWVGVIAAVSVCVGTAAVLQVVDNSLPAGQQERLETVVALIAIVMVTSMVVWMARHARGLRGELELRAGAAVAKGSAFALIAMAFLAVLREGFETAVFLLSAFQASTSRVASSTGAVLGIVLAIFIGYAIYRGGGRINLSKFFTATGLVLVLVAAGLASFAMHTGHEAGWITVGQSQLIDLSWLIKPDSLQSALFTGVLGIQPKPTMIEGLGWLGYFVPACIFVLRSSRSTGRPLPRPVPLQRDVSEEGVHPLPTALCQ